MAWPKGVPRTSDEIARISAAQKGRTFSPEHRKKIGDARRGRVMGPRPDWVKAKISAGKMGNTCIRDATVKGECVYCFGIATARDHVIPKGRPGWDDPDNLVPACFSCNASKGNRTPEEWFAALTN